MKNIVKFMLLYTRILYEVVCIQNTGAKIKTRICIFVFCIFVYKLSHTVYGHQIHGYFLDLIILTFFVTFYILTSLLFAGHQQPVSMVESEPCGIVCFCRKETITRERFNQAEISVLK